MAPEYWDKPQLSELDEDTAVRERTHAEGRIAAAQQGAERTAEVVSTVRGLISHARELHRENHYVQRLLPIFQGTHRA